MGEVCPAVKGRVIALDGKALRGSARAREGLRALHQVSAYASEYGLTLEQRKCEEKSNEITAIQELLPTLSLEGSVVTIDAMGCQSAIAARIIEGGGDYVLAVKDNQPHLAEALRDFFSTPMFRGIISGKFHCTRPGTRGTVGSRRAAVRRSANWTGSNCLV
jgi:predicted transposase YbfD/YdcC